MILRKGSRGKEVRKIQEFLGLRADGIFGQKTHKRICEWQREAGLTVNGIIDFNTWSTMGFISTDNSELTKTLENGLIINMYFLPRDEYMIGCKPKYVFLHHTAGWHNPYKTINNWANDSRGKIATEFVLGGPSIKDNDDRYDGALLQCMPKGCWGWHLGIGMNRMHKNSVGIEVNNFGWVNNGKTYAGQYVSESQRVTLKKPFRGYKTWHRYSDKQIEVLRDWILWVGERDNIDVRAGLPALVKEKGADAFEFNQDVLNGNLEGLWNHANVRKDKSDMFPQQELLDMLTSL